MHEASAAGPTAPATELAPEADAPPSAAQLRRAARMATPRLRREKQTLSAMLRIYCADHHAPVPGGLCPECAALQDYADKRLAACPFGPDKPTCANCQIHCYGPQQREAVRQVMRHAGPRMLLKHPLLALAHLVVDGRRPAPPKPSGKAGARPKADASRAEPPASAR